MNIHIVTIGSPKLQYAVLGFDEYLGRLKRLHKVKVTHLADKYAYDSKKVKEVIGNSYLVALEIEGRQFSSEELAKKLDSMALLGKNVVFLIGGPDGLPEDIRTMADLQWSLGKNTLPHDLAMVVTMEALYRASMISAGIPYHR